MGTPLAYGVADVDPTFWDVVKLGDKESPGLATVEVDRANKSDEKKAKGESGSTKEYSGADTAKVSIRIRYIYDIDHINFVDVILPIIEPNPEKKKVEAIAISHAVTIARKIKSITVDKVSGPNKAGDGIWEWAIEATEFREPSKKNATGTFKGPKPNGADCGAMQTYRNSLLDMANNERRQAEQTVTQMKAGIEAVNLVSDTTGVEGAAPPELVALKAKYEQHLAMAKVYDAQAQAAWSQMQAMGCFESKPSGNPNVTQP